MRIYFLSLGVSKIKGGKTFTRGPKLRSLARSFQDYNSYRSDQPVSSLLFHPFNEKKA